MLPALATALQLSTFTPASNARAARATAGVWMQEVEASIEVSADAETSMDMAAAVPEKNERFKAISLNALDEWAERFPRLKVEAKDIKLASLIFPFKARSAQPCAPSAHAHSALAAPPVRSLHGQLLSASKRADRCTSALSLRPSLACQASPYLVEELIDWGMKVRTAHTHARTVGVGETGGAGLRASAASPSTAAAPRRPPPIHLSSTGAARLPTAPAHTPHRATSRTIRSTGWSSRRWTCSRRTTAQRS